MSDTPTNPVLDLVNAAWAMCVEQQHHAAPGWSMAKSWAWDRLREAVEPFLVRDPTGDVIEMVAEPPVEERPPLIVMDETDAAFRLLRDQYNAMVTERDRREERIRDLRQEVTALQRRLAVYEGGREPMEAYLESATELLGSPAALQRVVAAWLQEEGL